MKTKLAKARFYARQYDIALMRGDAAWDPASCAFFGHEWKVSAFLDAASALLDGEPARRGRRKLGTCVPR